MLSLLSLHGSGRDETDLADFCHQLAPQARFIAPRGPFAQAGGYTFFRRRSDRSIDAAEVLNLATAWVSQEAEAHLRASGEVIAVGYSSGASVALTTVRRSCHQPVMESRISVRPAAAET